MQLVTQRQLLMELHMSYDRWQRLEATGWFATAIYPIGKRKKYNYLKIKQLLKIYDHEQLESVSTSGDATA